MTKLDDAIKAKWAEIEALDKRKWQRNDRQHRIWQGKFVHEIQEASNSFHSEITEEGHRELERNGLKYTDKRDVWNKGVMYTPDECFCLVCHSHNIYTTVEYGIAPRYAACPRHADFLLLGPHLRKIE